MTLFRSALAVLLVAACSVRPPPKFYDNEMSSLGPLLASGHFKTAVDRSFVIFTYDWDEAGRVRRDLERNPGYLQALKDEFARRTAEDVDAQTSTALILAVRDGAITESERTTYLSAADRKRAERAEELRKANEDRAHLAVLAAQNSHFSCRNTEHCRKAFALAQIFVNQHSDMKIQVATDTIVETFNPTEDYKIGLRVVKLPGPRDSAELSLETICKVCSPMSMQVRLLTIQSEFAPFISSRLVD